METARDWSSGLPVDVLAAIFGNLSVHDILTGAGLVCRSWSGAAKLPGLWRSVDMSRMPYEHLFNPGRVFICRMAMVAVRRAAGRLEAFAGWVFVTDELLYYMAERSPYLVSLRVTGCAGVTNRALAAVVDACPRLERLHVVE